MALQLSAGYQLKTPTAPVRWGFFPTKLQPVWFKKYFYAQNQATNEYFSVSTNIAKDSAGSVTAGMRKKPTKNMCTLTAVHKHGCEPNM